MARYCRNNPPVMRVCTGRVDTRGRRASDWSATNKGRNTEPQRTRDPAIALRSSTYENGRMTWLLTGGAGYIGGHVARCLTRAGHPVLILDALSTGDASRVVGFPLVTASILADWRRLTEIMVEHGVRCIVHLAANKAVGESVQRPLFYYEQNVQGSLALLRAAVDAGVRQILYSSSAAVYGDTAAGPVGEDHPTAPTSPYGATKLAAGTA